MPILIVFCASADETPTMSPIALARLTNAFCIAVLPLALALLGQFALTVVGRK